MYSVSKVLVKEVGTRRQFPLIRSNNTTSTENNTAGKDTISNSLVHLLRGRVFKKSAGDGMRTEVEVGKHLHNSEG